MSAPYTTISQVDLLVAQGPAPIEILSPFERRFAAASDIHRKLLHLKKLYREHPDVERSYNDRRRRQLDSVSAPQGMYLEGYKRVLMEISQDLGGALGNDQVHRFLDLGFSPGGFSNWLLENNPRATGVGITLPDSEAKYKYEPTGFLADNRRYAPYFANIITLVLQALRDRTNPISSLLASNGNSRAPTTFDLIIAGAFPTLEGSIPWYQRVQLALCQVYIVLNSLQTNGIAIFVINTKPFRWQVEMIAMIKDSFRSVDTMKGSLHTTRTSCYLVCRGFQTSRARNNISTYTRWLKATLTALDRIAIEASNDTAHPATLAENDPELQMPSISGRRDEDVFNAEHAAVLRLFEPRWREQFNAIRDEFKTVLERSRGGMGSSSSNWRSPPGGQTPGRSSTGFGFSRSTGGGGGTGASSSGSWRRGR
ncbi:unnamed protein product [Somion occarium]|uniref:Ribosomal RNA methyltransferase FtsJ domain-containing protein n=1 Tax=Somion occarium TaxID=3059160 RepID=A0ABP1DT83_9APHY